MKINFTNGLYLTVRHWARWSDGRAALIGDAAHPMLPFLAQGAAMAIEDGWVVIDALSKSLNDIPSAFKTYETRRAPRTRAVHAKSSSNMKRFHHQSKLAKLVNYGPMWGAGRFVPSFIRRQFDWIYEYDPTLEIDPI